jgi:hypothetical protein
MRLIERDLDDHLTDDEVAERFDALDRMAQRSSDALAIADPLGVAGTEAVIRHGYGRAALGVIGIVVMVLGAAAVLYGARGEEPRDVTTLSPGTMVCTKDGGCVEILTRDVTSKGTFTSAIGVPRDRLCGDGWTPVLRDNGGGRWSCAWVVKDPE